MSHIVYSRRNIQEAKGTEMNAAVRHSITDYEKEMCHELPNIYPRVNGNANLTLTPGRRVFLFVGEVTKRKVGAPAELQAVVVCAAAQAGVQLIKFGQATVDSVRATTFEDLQAGQGPEMIVSEQAGYIALTWFSHSADNPACIRCAVLSLATLEWESLRTIRPLDGEEDRHQVTFGADDLGIVVRVNYLPGAKTLMASIYPNETALTLPPGNEFMCDCGSDRPFYVEE